MPSKIRILITILCATAYCTSRNEKCECSKYTEFNREFTSYWTTAYSDNRIYAQPSADSEVLFEVPHWHRISMRSETAFTTEDARGIWISMEWGTRDKTSENRRIEGWMRTKMMHTERSMAETLGRATGKLAKMGTIFSGSKVESSGDAGCSWSEHYRLEFEPQYLSFTIGAGYSYQKVNFARMYKPADASELNNEFTIVGFALEPMSDTRYLEESVITISVSKKSIQVKTVKGPPIIGLPDTFTPGAKERFDLSCKNIEKKTP